MKYDDQPPLTWLTRNYSWRNFAQTRWSDIVIRSPWYNFLLQSECRVSIDLTQFIIMFCNSILHKMPGQAMYIYLLVKSIQLFKSHSHSLSLNVNWTVLSPAWALSCPGGSDVNLVLFVVVQRDKMWCSRKTFASFLRSVSSWQLDRFANIKNFIFTSIIAGGGPGAKSPAKWQHVTGLPGSRHSLLALLLVLVLGDSRSTRQNSARIFDTTENIK